MFEAYWGLRESPFRAAYQREYFFASPIHDEALARMDFLVEQRRSLGILSGPDGMGKSLLLATLAHDFRRRGATACYVNLFGAESRSFAWSLAAELGTNPFSDEDAFALWRRVADRLQEHHCQGRATVFLLDDAEQGTHDVLVQVLRLAKIHAGTVTIVLAVEESRCSRLGDDLLQRADLWIRLEPWGRRDVEEYLQVSLERAGRKESAFHETAVTRLCELSGGVPRWVGQLAELALVAGAAQGLEAIDTDTVEAVYEELSQREGLSTKY
jgi:general secretion pathway protein A